MGRLINDRHCYRFGRTHRHRIVWGRTVQHRRLELGATVIRAALDRAAIDAADVSDVVLGHVLTAGQGQNSARQAAISAGIPVEKAALTINQVCGSGLRAVALGYQAIKAGDATIVVAGGQENMSASAHCAHLRNGTKMGALEFTDTMIKDGLWDAFNGYHMGTTAENVAELFQISRTDQDAFAVASQHKAAAAQASGKFKDEIVPVTVHSRKGDIIVDTDEHPKASTTADSLAKLRPAFSKTGSVTAGNASGLNDGASVTILMSAAEAQRRGLTPLARIASWRRQVSIPRSWEQVRFPPAGSRCRRPDGRSTILI